MVRGGKEEREACEQRGGLRQELLLRMTGVASGAPDHAQVVIILSGNVSTK